MTKSAITFILFAVAFDTVDRAPNRDNPACEIWSDAPGDEICEGCAVSAIEPVELRDGTVVRELACQGDDK